MSPSVTTGKARGSRTRLAAVVAAVLGTVVIAALAMGGFIRLPGADRTVADKLSISLSSTPHAALLHLAAAKGYFADEGLEVKLVPVSHGKAALDLLSQGQVDLAAAAEVPFVIGVLNGEPFSVAANMLSVSGEMAVVARRDRGISAPHDLIGKTVGATFGTSGEYFLWAFFIRHRLAPEQIKLVDVPPGRMVQALAEGTIDAAATWQPLRLDAEVTLGRNAVSFIAPDAYTVTHIVVGRAPALKQGNGAVRKLVAALLRAEAFNRADPQQALGVVAARLRQDPAVLRSTWNELDIRVALRQSQLVTWEDEARWAIARGHAQPQPVPNFLAHVYMDALLEQRPERVTIAY